VRLARDGVPVVIHDATLERTALRPGRVESLNSTELREADAGSWFNRRFPSLAREAFARERVPTLSEVFGRFGPRAGVLYVELKCEEAATRPALARAVVRLVREHGLAERVVVKSFEHDSIEEVKRVAPEVRTAALFHRGWRRPHFTASAIVERALACGADEVSLHVSLLGRRVVEAARGRGLRTIVWTADSTFWLRRACALGLRAVITNRPAEMRAALAELESRR
jgi:glycerophosphoryl diester phosphodiesterase